MSLSSNTLHTQYIITVDICSCVQHLHFLWPTKGSGCCVETNMKTWEVTASFAFEYINIFNTHACKHQHYKDALSPRISASLPNFHSDTNSLRYRTGLCIWLVNIFDLQVCAFSDVLFKFNLLFSWNGCNSCHEETDVITVNICNKVCTIKLLGAQFWVRYFICIHQRGLAF